MSGTAQELKELRDRVSNLEEVCAMLADNLLRKFGAKDMRHWDAMERAAGLDIEGSATAFKQERE